MTDNNYDLIVAYILKNQDKFYRLAYTYIKNPDGAMDVVQSAICRALEKHALLKDRDAVNTWFYKILVNECLTYLRRHSKEVLIDEEDWENHASGIYLEAAFEPGEDVLSKLDRLSPDVKTVILLYYFEELTLKEIAEVTQTNLNTVKSRMYSGLRKLKMIINKS